MTAMQSFLFDIGRIGMGATFFLTVFVDISARSTVFDLMRKKHVPLPWLFYFGAMALKALTGLALVVNYHTFWAANLLLAYIFIANIIFNNFWAVPAQQRPFSFVLFLTYLSSCFGLLLIASAGR